MRATTTEPATTASSVVIDGNSLIAAPAMDEPDTDESADQPKDGGEESEGFRSFEAVAETSMDETSPVESIATACDRESASFLK